jgi:hypothetical protein
MTQPSFPMLRIHTAHGVQSLSDRQPPCSRTKAAPASLEGGMVQVLLGSWVGTCGRTLESHHRSWRTHLTDALFEVGFTAGMMVQNREDD